MGDEALIRATIWRIIEEEIGAGCREDLPTKTIVANIKRRVNETLNRYDAILVYQP